MDDDDVLDINDPCVPIEIREQAARFRTPVCYVGLDGADFYLFAEDGELVDMGYLK